MHGIANINVAANILLFMNFHQSEHQWIPLFWCLRSDKDRHKGKGRHKACLFNLLIETIPTAESIQCEDVSICAKLKWCQKLRSFGCFYLWMGTHGEGTRWKPQIAMRLDDDESVCGARAWSRPRLLRPSLDWSLFPMKCCRKKWGLEFKKQVFAFVDFDCATFRPGSR